MSRPTPPSSELPPETAGLVRTYLGAFLPAAAVDEAVAEVTAGASYWGDRDTLEVLTVAHTVLASRLRVAADVEALVLNEDVGLTVEDVAAVLDLPAARVRALLDEALAVLADPDALEAAGAGTTAPDAPTPPATSPRPDPPPAQPSTPPVPRRRSRRALAASLAVAAVVLVAVVVAAVRGGGDACPAGAPVCVDASVLTTGVDDATGAPGQDRTRFAVGDDVVLWFSFERREPDPAPLEVRWYRDGVPLYATEVRLGTGDRLNVSLLSIMRQEPGAYRVEVAAADGALLLDRRFTITDADA